MKKSRGNILTVIYINARTANWRKNGFHWRHTVLTSHAAVFVRRVLLQALTYKKKFKAKYT